MSTIIAPKPCVMCDRVRDVRVMPFPGQSLIWFAVGYLAAIAGVWLW